MAESTLVLLGLVVFAALAFDFINGFHDTANAIATCISTRALSIRAAIIMSAGVNFLGAVVASRGFGDLKWNGISKILAAIVISPVAGTLIAFLIMIGIYWAFRDFHPSPLNRGFRKLQILSAAFLGFSHGSNDAQKSMGVITMALVSFGAIQTFHIPVWVIFSCAASMAFGTAMGGWRIIKTVGSDFVKLQPVHGFCAETSSAGEILTASAMGIPSSTPHVITSAILATGLSQGQRKVNWDVGVRIVWAWILTIPASAVASYITYRLLAPPLERMS